MHFPDSGGLLLSANSTHAAAIDSFCDGVNDHFLGVPNVVVGRELPMYYDPQHSRMFVVPDVLVVLDHEARSLSSYMFRVEGRPPDFVLEVISPRSEIRNRERKKGLYEDLGIKEYFVFQPNMERAELRLVGFRLRGKKDTKGYFELSHDPAHGPDGALRSKVLGVSLRPDGERLRLRNLVTGKDYSWSTKKFETSAVASKKVTGAEERARREAQARRASDVRAAAADERARREAQERRASDERARQEAQERRASEQRARREAQARRASEQRARREAQARRASDMRAASAEKRAAYAEAHNARLQAQLVAAGIPVSEDS